MYKPWHTFADRRERFWRWALECALVSVLLIESGCGTCMYHGKLVGAKECKEMRDLGMDVQP